MKRLRISSIICDLDGSPHLFQGRLDRATMSFQLEERTVGRQLIVLIENVMGRPHPSALCLLEAGRKVYQAVQAQAEEVDLEDAEYNEVRALIADSGQSPIVQGAFEEAFAESEKLAGSATE